MPDLSEEEVKMCLGVRFIAEACVLLGLSHETRYRSLVLFHSFRRDMELASLCTASILLASKLEEEMCTLKKIVYVFHYLHSEYEGRLEQLTSRQSIRLKEGCIVAETEILKFLGFNAVFEDAYGALVDFLESESLSSECMQRIFSSFGSLMLCQDVQSLDSGALVAMAIEDAFGGEGRVRAAVERYKTFEGRRFDLETFKEIGGARRISSNLLHSFAKRQRRM